MSNEKKKTTKKRRAGGEVKRKRSKSSSGRRHAEWHMRPRGDDHQIVNFSKPDPSCWKIAKDGAVVPATAFVER